MVYLWPILLGWLTPKLLLHPVQEVTFKDQVRAMAYVVKVQPMKLIKLCGLAENNPQE